MSGLQGDQWQGEFVICLNCLYSIIIQSEAQRHVCTYHGYAKDFPLDPNRERIQNSPVLYADESCARWRGPDPLAKDGGKQGWLTRG